MEKNEEFLGCMLGDLLDETQLTIINKSRYSLINDLTIGELILYFNSLYPKYKRKKPSDKCHWILTRLATNYKNNDNN